MIVACPSCQTPFEADDALAGGPGLPLCDDCSHAVRVPRASRPSWETLEPLAPAAPSSEPLRRRRPKAPEISFAPRSAGEDEGRTASLPEPASAPELDFEEPPAPPPPAPPVTTGETPKPPAQPAPARPKSEPQESPPVSNRGERLSLGEIAPHTAGGPTRLDGGFDPFTQDAEPVSLHDLGVVLAPVASPPPWSGVSRTPKEDLPPPKVRQPSKPTIRATYARPAAPKAEAPKAAAPKAEAPKPAAAKVTEPAKVPAKAAKPRFFQVDSIPPPSVDIPIDVEEPPRNSGHDDLRLLIGASNDRTKKRPDADLLSLHGALFTDAPRPAPLPPDLALLLTVPEEPVTMGEPLEPPAPPQVVVPAPAPEPTPETAVPLVARRAVAVEEPPSPPAPPVPAVVATPPSPPPARPVFKSGAPGPVVSERRPAAAAAARRSGIASWAVAVASVTTVAIVVALRFGATPEPSGSDPVPEALTTTGAAVPPPRTVSPPQPTVEAPRAPTAEPAPSVEPARAVVERPSPSPPTPPPPTPTPPSSPPTAHSSPATPPPATPPPATPPPAVTRATPPPAESSAEFDRAAARAALAAAAGAAAGCKQPDDPTGVGKVSITFATSGRVTSARVTGAPFQGTRIGACIAATFRTVSVPPFGGDPVAVTKDVMIH